MQERDEQQGQGWAGCDPGLGVLQGLMLEAALSWNSSGGPPWLSPCSPPSCIWGGWGLRAAVSELREAGDARPSVAFVSASSWPPGQGRESPSMCPWPIPRGICSRQGLMEGCYSSWGRPCLALAATHHPSFPGPRAERGPFPVPLLPCQPWGMTSGAPALARRCSQQVELPLSFGALVREAAGSGPLGPAEVCSSLARTAMAPGLQNTRGSLPCGDQAWPAPSAPKRQRALQIAGEGIAAPRMTTRVRPPCALM